MCIRDRIYILAATAVGAIDSTRSALGNHRCFPGMGCICIPERADIDALASWVKAIGIRSLKVVN